MKLLDKKSLVIPGVRDFQYVCFNLALIDMYLFNSYCRQKNSILYKKYNINRICNAMLCTGGLHPKTLLHIGHLKWKTNQPVSLLLASPAKSPSKSRICSMSAMYVFCRFVLFVFISWSVFCYRVGFVFLCSTFTFIQYHVVVCVLEGRSFILCHADWYDNSLTQWEVQYQFSGPLALTWFVAVYAFSMSSKGPAFSFLDFYIYYCCCFILWFSIIILFLYIV